MDDHEDNVTKLHPLECRCQNRDLWTLCLHLTVLWIDKANGSCLHVVGELIGRRKKYFAIKSSKQILDFSDIFLGQIEEKGDSLLLMSFFPPFLSMIFVIFLSAEENVRFLPIGGN